MSLFYFADQVLMYENFDLESVVTPVDVKHFNQLLTEAGYMKEKIQFITQGFALGFDIGYQGPKDIALEAPNLRLRV